MCRSSSARQVFTSRCLWSSGFPSNLADTTKTRKLDTQRGSRVLHFHVLRLQVPLQLLRKVLNAEFHRASPGWGECSPARTSATLLPPLLAEAFFKNSCFIIWNCIYTRGVMQQCKGQWVWVRWVLCLWYHRAKIKLSAGDVISLEARGPLTRWVRYWQNSFPCGCRAEVLIFFLADSWRLQSTPRGHLLIILAQHSNLLFQSQQKYNSLTSIPSFKSLPAYLG